MKIFKNLSDDQHSSIEQKAQQLTSGLVNQTDKLERIFLFVRDEILFGFPSKWDAVKASETLVFKKGYCNTKATLMVALCKAAGIPARIHTGLIDINIMRGLFPSFVFLFLPAVGGHSWVEVKMDNHWLPIDSYINDKVFYTHALQKLEESGKSSAYSISHAKGISSCEFNFGEKGFVHMGAVVEDQGVWDDFSDYMSSDKYIGMNRLQSTMFPAIARISNQRINKIREM
jgi:hypothetical protein